MRVPAVRSRRGLVVSVVLVAIVATGCDWPMFRNGPAHTGFNTTESKIGAGNVGSLVNKWWGFTNRTDYLSVRSSPAVAKGVAYVGGNAGDLHAFDAAGTTGCSGSGVPKFCAPLWTGHTGPISSSPAVANGVVYIGSDDGTFYAFDAVGTTGCSGSPKTCPPLWTAAGVGASPPT